MKKISLSSALLTLAVLVNACDSIGISASNTSGNTSTDGMTPALRLALGTLQLEGTVQAVDADMAAELLPLWQLLNELENNSSTAPEEVTAVIEKIETVMTPDQIKAINDMQISQQDISTATQGGLSNNTKSQASNSSAQSSVQGRMLPPEAGVLDNGMPPEAGIAPAGQGTGARAKKRAPAQKFQAADILSLNPLIERIIKLMESKIQS